MKRVSFIGVFCLLLSCNPAGLEQSIDQTFVATPRELSVPDSSRYDNIQVHIVAFLGPSTAYSLERIEKIQTDTLFRFVVFGRYKEKTGDVHVVLDVVLDSTLVLSLDPPKYGEHYFRVYDSQSGSLLDSTFVY